MKWSKLILIDLTLMFNVVVIIIVTRLLASSRIITQYFNHLLLYNFTTSSLKIDDQSSTSNYSIHCLEYSATNMNS